MSDLEEALSELARKLARARNNNDLPEGDVSNLIEYNLMRVARVNTKSVEKRIKHLNNAIHLLKQREACNFEEGKDLALEKMELALVILKNIQWADSYVSLQEACDKWGDCWLDNHSLKSVTACTRGIKLAFQKQATYVMVNAVPLKNQ